MSNHLPEAGKESKVTRDGIGDFIYSEITPGEPCTYCGHTECGGGRPYDSTHEPRYCSVCWAESKPGVVGMQSLNPASVDQVSVLEEILQELKRANEITRAVEYNPYPTRRAEPEPIKPKPTRRGL